MNTSRLHHRAAELLARGHFWPSELVVRQLLAREPQDPVAWMIRARCRESTGDRSGALAACQQVWRFAGARADILLDLGSLYAGMNRRHEADKVYARLLESEPDSLPGLVNRGNVKLGLGEVAAAADYQRQAIALKPDLPEAHYNLASALFHMGETEAAFEAYEWRWKVGAFTTKPPVFDQPRWDGDRSCRGRLLITPEQGLGDSIHFIRFARMAKAVFDEVIVEAPRPLMRLFGPVEGIDRILPFGGPYPEFDRWLPMLSLPHLLRLRQEDYPSTVYLPRGDGRNVCPDSGGRLRVGFSWTGNPQSRNNHLRSSTFTDFMPLLTRPDIQPVNLQKDVPAGQFDDEKLGGRIIDPMRDIADFEDTANIIRGLDLVVTVDNVIAHLAGAMGVPVFVLLPTLPDWRWGLTGDRSFWYSSMRLFREDRKDGWRPAFAAVAEAVSDFRQSGH